MGHEGGVLMNVIITLIKKKVSKKILTSFHIVSEQQEGAGYELKRGLALNHTGTLISEVPASRAMRNKCL